jgi:chaperone BCS1
MEIRNDERLSYRRMVKWLTVQPKIMARNRKLECTDLHDDVFGFGSSWFFYKWRLVRIYRTRQDDADTASLSTREAISFRMWGRNQKILSGLMTDANRLAVGDGIRPFIDLYTATAGEWKYMGCLLKRSLDSVVLKKGQMEGLIRRIQLFRDGQDKYRELGVPHRLGIMLEGPPGTGKTSTIVALASHFDAELKVINLAAMNDEMLTKLCGGLGSSNACRFIVFEDADCVFNGREREDENGRAINPVTFSGLLNAIDGIASGENRILFMTTNHVEKLDPALIRPGRIDVSVNMEVLDAEQAGRMYARFFDDDNTEFVVKYTGKSAATAQEHLVQRYFGTNIETIKLPPAPVVNLPILTQPVGVKF